MLGVLAAPAVAAELRNVVSYTLYAAGPCDGQNYIPAFIGSRSTWFSPEGSMIDAKASGTAMPDDRDLWVIGASLTVEYLELDPKYFAAAWAYSGIANDLGGDVINPKVIGPATNTVMFPPRAAMKLASGDIGRRHIDVHISCPSAGKATWRATLTVYTVTE